MQQEERSSCDVATSRASSCFYQCYDKGMFLSRWAKYCGSITTPAISLLYSNDAVYNLLLWDVSLRCVYLFMISLLCALFGVFLWFIYAGNSIERISLWGGELVYSLHAYFMAIWSNRFKIHYQRCMLLQYFGSSDEASGEAAWGIYVHRECVTAPCVCVCLFVCIWMICFRGRWCLEKQPVLIVNPEVHRVYLELETWHKISSTKHQSVSYKSA